MTVQLLSLWHVAYLWRLRSTVHKERGVQTLRERAQQVSLPFYTGPFFSFPALSKVRVFSLYNSSYQIPDNFLHNFWLVSLRYRILPTKFLFTYSWFFLTFFADFSHCLMVL
uniref:Uncharacterized protein n=1 Tax=Vitis vinifera TaxID=29760 RepID=F6HIH3_VITVI